MRRSRPALFLVATVAVACSAGPGPVVEPAPAPAPTTTSSVAEPRTPDAHGVAEVRVTLDPRALRVGDTARVEAAAFDTTGALVEGIEFQVRAPRRLLGVIDDGRSVVAVREGTGTVTAQATRGAVPLSGVVPGAAEVTIAPAPLVALALTAPDRMYAGTRGTVQAVARTAFGAREAPPEITWRSSDPLVVGVSDHAVLTAVAPGSVRIQAAAEGVTAEVTVRVISNPVRDLEIAPVSADVRVGEVVHLTLRALGADGREIDDAPVDWSVGVRHGAPRAAAVIGPDGEFVANAPGTFRVVGTVGELSAAADVRARSRPPRRSVALVGHHPAPIGAGSTTDLWVFEGVDGRDYAYTGTLTAATMYAWDVTNPAAPVLADSVKLDGRRVNDVKINEDATIAVVTSEGASNRRNGITLLDILDPRHPRPITHFTENLTGGVHNVWIEGDLVYAVHNGTRDLHVVDISDPAVPRHVGRWGLEAEGRALHDVMVKDGLAYLSYWNDGLVILDVGAGIAGGTPIRPVFVSRHVYSYPLGDEIYGNTHHAIRYRNWVFVADEIFGCSECVNGPRGYVHVIDVADIENPVEVAYYRVPEAGAHNLWVQDDRLYVAYYQAGVRVVDVSGELRGDLWRQGREVGWYMTETSDGDVPNAAMAWGPQPYKGLLYVSDLNSGLWVLRPETESRELVP